MSNKLLRAFAAAGVIVTAAASTAAQDELSKGDREWMEKEVGPIITQQETEMFQEIDKDDRKLFKELFWMRRDYDPSTSDNEYREGYEDRLDRADDLFKSRGRKGSESDMGKIFALMGAPSDQQQGGVAGEGGLPEIPAAPENERANEGTAPANVPGAGSAGGSDSMLWIYEPNPSLGIPDGLAIEFRQRPPFGYRIANMDDIDEHLERVKERMVANRAISYSLDADGRLREPDDKFDPGSPAKTLLSELRATGETSSGIDFTATPSYFQAAGESIYVPINFVISDGPTSENVTFVYAIENADGFEAGQAEEPVQLTKDNDGRWRYEYPIQVEPGLYTLYVGFLDSNAQVHGTQIVDLDVPEFEGDELELSSVVMFSSADRTGEVNGTPGNAFLLAGYHFKPKSDNVYNHSERLQGVFNAYNYGVDGEEANLTLLVSFYKDGEKRGQTEDGPFMVQAPQMALTVFDIPLNIPNFKEPGEYRIELTVTDHVKDEVLKEERVIVIE